MISQPPKTESAVKKVCFPFFFFFCNNTSFYPLAEKISHYFGYCSILWNTDPWKKETFFTKSKEVWNNNYIFKMMGEQKL